MKQYEKYDRTVWEDFCIWSEAILRTPDGENGILTTDRAMLVNSCGLPCGCDSAQIDASLNELGRKMFEEMRKGILYDCEKYKRKAGI